LYKIKQGAKVSIAKLVSSEAFGKFITASCMTGIPTYALLLRKTDCVNEPRERFPTPIKGAPNHATVAINRVDRIKTKIIFPQPPSNLQFIIFETSKQGKATQKISLLSSLKKASVKNLLCRKNTPSPTIIMIGHSVLIAASN
jgi:hypothetical protein